MPYKDRIKQLEFQKKHYQKHKEKYNTNFLKRKLELRDWFKELRKGLSCIKCGENHIACLDFHHIDKDKKIMGICQMVREGFAKENILEEVKKCIVLCSNCHRKLHWDEK